LDGATAEIDAAVGFQRQKGPEVVAMVAAPGLVQRVAMAENSVFGGQAQVAACPRGRREFWVLGLEPEARISVGEIEMKSGRGLNSRGRRSGKTAARYSKMELILAVRIRF
jgi:hypothetical protein